MMVAYANGEMKQDDKLMVMRGNNRHFTRLVIPHELIPGHHLQGYYAARGPQRPFSTSFYVEGWALYWECGCGTWAGRRRPRTASACSSGG